MKENIYHATATVARRITFAAEQGITKDNVLGVINKTTGKLIYSPLKYTKLSMSQAADPNPDGTKNYTLYFDNAVFHPVGIGDNLLIKIYSEGEAKQLQPTAEIVERGVMLHFITLVQMEKMHIRIEGTDTGTLGFVLTNGTDTFELRFSADSPQAFAGQLVYDDAISIVDFVFGDLLVQIPTGYNVPWVLIDGVDANLLEADVNWRLADIQKQLGEAGRMQMATQEEEVEALQDLKDNLN